MEKVATNQEKNIRAALLKYKLALQPNKHFHTWSTIAKTIHTNWKDFSTLFKTTDSDFLQLKKLVTKDYKKEFPYLSGPKIFNYWSFIISTYGKVSLKNTNYIDIAPDTHISQCSVKLGLITKDEAKTISKEMLSQKWRAKLKNSGINPIDMHPPLWFWSRNGFVYTLKQK